MKIKKLTLACLISFTILLVVILIVCIDSQKKQSQDETTAPSETEAKEPTQDPYLTSDAITVDLLPLNEYSRPGTKLTQVNAIVIHYVGNAGTTAVHNRNYFEGLAESKSTSASSHYIIGLEGEIIQCVPLDEVAYASNERNYDTIAIECCHPDEGGQFTDATYRALVELTAALCNTYGLEPETDVIRHYDITGKKCPLYYVDHEDAWYLLKLDIKDAMR